MIALKKEAAKRAYIENLFLYSSNTFDTLKNINQLLCKHKLNAAFPQSMKTNEKMITYPQQIYIELNKHFVGVSENLNDKLQQTTPKNMHKKSLQAKLSLGSQNCLRACLVKEDWRC